MPLLLHDASTGKTKLNARKGMYGVVDASVIRAEAAQHGAVGRVHYGVAAERGNVALPERETPAHERHVLFGRHAPRAQLLLQIGVLHAQELPRCGHGRPYVEKRPKQPFLRRFARRRCGRLAPFPEQGLNKPCSALALRHALFPASSASPLCCTAWAGQ